MRWILKEEPDKIELCQSEGWKGNKGSELGAGLNYGGVGGGVEHGAKELKLCIFGKREEWGDPMLCPNLPPMHSFFTEGFVALIVGSAT